MGGKSRSGLANDRRAYPCRTYCAPQICSISLADIATFDGEEWALNNNTTILACQTLTIGLGIYLFIQDGLILTNKGTIINNGTVTANNGGSITNSTSFVNNGRIYILDASQFINSVSENSSPILTSNGEITIAVGGILYNGRSTLNNSGYIYNRGTITNLEAVINNYNGNIINNDRGVISNENATINNRGGTITNNINGTITNQSSSIIYNNTGGTITQNAAAIFTNYGIINNADGSSTCGVGTINGTITGSGTFGTSCS